MSKKKHKTSARERHAFPFLDKGIKQRLKASGAIDMTGNYKIESKGQYWTIAPIDRSKKIK